MAGLKNKVVFITGGTTGIGKAAALKCLQDGAKVFVMGRSQERLEKMLTEQYGQSIDGYAGNVADEKAVNAAFQACEEALGSVDVLINNAGIGIPTPDVAETDAHVFDQMLNTNLKGVFLCSRAALKMMKQKNAGHIINIISMAGQRTNPGSPVYCASKFGARGLSSGIADQVLKQGIKVTDVNPGPVDSDYWGNRKVPRDRFLQVQDVADVIHFVLTVPDHVVIREINFDNIKWLAK